MSTRSTTHFIWRDAEKVEAIVYRHSDGYPKGAGTDIYKFFEDVKAQVSHGDTRFEDPTYLAAKYVVWLARMFASTWVSRDEENNVKPGFISHANERPMDFLSVGVCMSDPGDIEYRYIVDCYNLTDGMPTVTCESPDRKRQYGIPRPGKEKDHGEF